MMDAHERREYQAMRLVVAYLLERLGGEVIVPSVILIDGTGEFVSEEVMEVPGSIRLRVTTHIPVNLMPKPPEQEPEPEEEWVLPTPAPKVTLGELEGRTAPRAAWSDEEKINFLTDKLAKEMGIPRAEAREAVLDMMRAQTVNWINEGVDVPF